MASPNSAYAVRRLQLDPVLWTAVVAPIDCTSVGLYRAESDKFKIRSDSGDPGQELEVGIGILHTIKSNPGSANCPFQVGMIICYVQASSSVGTAVAEFVR